MIQETSERIGMIARAYWQPLVLTVLVLIALGQLYSWGSTYVELRKVDSLVAKTADLVPVKAEKPSSPPSGPPGAPPQSDAGRKPKVNIFKREQIPYQLTAIYMKDAIIDGQSVQVGGRVGKAVVKDIATSTVVIQEDGVAQPRTLQMFQGGEGPSQKMGPGGQGRMGGMPPKQGGKVAVPGPVLVSPKSSGGPPIDDKTFNKLSNMSRDERRAFIEKLSPEERKQLQDMKRSGGG